jgi:hypothetical protein
MKRLALLSTPFAPSLRLSFYLRLTVTTYNLVLLLVYHSSTSQASFDYYKIHTSLSPTVYHDGQQQEWQEARGETSK